MNAVARLKGPIERPYKDIGYLRTRWIYTLPGHRGRLIIKFLPGEKKNSIEVRTEAQWLEEDEGGSGYLFPVLLSIGTYTLL